MAHITLNQEDLLKIFNNETILNSVIQHYETEFEKRGEVICNIRINDLTLSESDENRFRETPVSQIRSLEVSTEDPENLFREVLDYWKVHLSSLIESADQLSHNLRTKPLDQCATELSCFIDQNHLLVNSLNSVNSLCQHRQIHIPANWNSSEVKLWMAFNQLLDSFNEKDTLSMADIIEYDLANSLQIWTEVIGEMTVCP